MTATLSPSDVGDIEARAQAARVCNCGCCESNATLATNGRRDTIALVAALREAWKERDAARALIKQGTLNAVAECDREYDKGAQQMRDRAVSLCRGRAHGYDEWCREGDEAMKCANAIETLPLESK